MKEKKISHVHTMRSVRNDGLGHGSGEQIEADK